MCPLHYQRMVRHGDPNVATPDKVCSDCDKRFTPRNSQALRCDSCKAVYHVVYNRGWRKSNPTYHADYNKQWRAEHADTYLEYHAKYRRENRDVVRQRYNEWAARNPDYARLWVEANRERARETVRRRRARLRLVAAFAIAERDIRRMLVRQGGRCAYCQAELGESYHVDHVVPVSRGGSNSIGNLAAACPPCNVSKSNWLLSEWRYRDRLSAPLQRKKSTHVRLEAA